MFFFNKRLPFLFKNPITENMKRKDFLKMLTAGAIGYQFSSLPGITIENPTVGEYDLNAHFVNRGPGLGRRIALTFDDGPSPGITDVVLKELAKRSVTATFFMIGNKVERYATLAKEVSAAGHEIGNHSYTHPALSSLSAEKVDAEIQKTQDVIANVTGKAPVWFRPPYGAFRKDQGYIPRSKSLGVAYWSVDPRDWAKPGVSTIVSRVTSATNPGSIVLLHDLHTQTRDAVGSILDNLMESSFSFTPLSGFLGAPYGPAYNAALAKNS
jgi:peptidoglycan-N-acetylglucosamine deacetylase